MKRTLALGLALLVSCMESNRVSAPEVTTIRTIDERLLGDWIAVDSSLEGDYIRRDTGLLSIARDTMDFVHLFDRSCNRFVRRGRDAVPACSTSGDAGSASLSGPYDGAIRDTLFIDRELALPYRVLGTDSLAMTLDSLRWTFSRRRMRP